MRPILPIKSVCPICRICSVSYTHLDVYKRQDQRRDVSVCNYGLKLSTGNNAYQMNTFAGMGVGKYRINWKKVRDVYKRQMMHRMNLIL